MKKYLIIIVTIFSSINLFADIADIAAINETEANLRMENMNRTFLQTMKRCQSHSCGVQARALHTESVEFFCDSVRHLPGWTRPECRSRVETNLNQLRNQERQ